MAKVGLHDEQFAGYLGTGAQKQAHNYAARHHVRKLKI
jgi:hypothetical protein